MKQAEKWNPYFVSYSKAHKNSPEEQREKDAAKYPGGLACGFLCWMNRQRIEFKKQYPDAFYGDYIRDHKAWGEFLNGNKRMA